MAVEHPIIVSNSSEELMASLRQRPSPEEIARRTRVVDQMLKLRQAIGPIRMTLEELLGEEDHG